MHLLILLNSKQLTLGNFQKHCTYHYTSRRLIDNTIVMALQSYDNETTDSIELQPIPRITKWQEALQKWS